MKSIHNEATASSPSATLERLWSLTLLLGHTMGEGLSERGLTMARAVLIWELQAGGPVTQRALSRALRVTPRNVTGLVDALEADGLVERRAHPGDRRATLVQLTGDGEKLAATLRREQDAFAEYLFGDLSQRDLDRIAKALARLVERVRAVVESPPD